MVNLFSKPDEVGIHARPAGMLVNEAKKYESNIVLVKGEKRAETLRLMAIMAMGVKCGDEVTIEITGTDEENAFVGMKDFFAANL